MQKKLKQHRQSNSLTLYSVVFGAVSVKYAVFILLLFFILNPAIPAFAADEEEAQTAESEIVEEAQEEEEVPEEQVEKSDETDEVSDSGDENLQQEEEVSSDNADEYEVEIDSIENENNSSTEIIDDESEEQVADESESGEEKTVENESTDGFGTTTVVTLENTDQDIATTTDNATSFEVGAGSDSATTSLETATSSATTTEQESATSENNQNNDENESAEVNENEDEADTEEQAEDISKDDDENFDNNTSTSTKATSSKEVATSTHETKVSVVSFVNNDMNAHQFADTDCISVGEGAFYCNQGEDTEDFIENGVYSAPDNDGDLEIFIHKDGEDVQISNNKVDDSAPYYDSYSDKIVWHSMIQDRYQIVLYDVQTGEQQVLTETPYNNMEPVIYKDVVLWQAWIGGNWEIMKYEKSSTTQLTKNNVHDVTPHMRGGYVLWQTQFVDGWRVAAYDTESGGVEYIGESEGSLIENPRMVLVYDSTNETGDVTTLGYDFNSKSSFIIENIPTDIPEKLPEPDQTGETRALIQTKSTLREVGVEEDTDSQTTGINAAKATGNATSTEEALSLDLSKSTSTSNVASSTPGEIEDIVVESGNEASLEENATTTAHIEDLVIPQMSTSTEEEIG